MSTILSIEDFLFVSDNTLICRKSYLTSGCFWWGDFWISKSLFHYQTNLLTPVLQLIIIIIIFPPQFFLLFLEIEKIYSIIWIEATHRWLLWVHTWLWMNKWLSFSQSMMTFGRKVCLFLSRELYLTQNQSVK